MEFSDALAKNGGKKSYGAGMVSDDDDNVNV